MENCAIHIDLESVYTPEQLGVLANVPFSKTAAIADMQKGIFTPNANKDAYGMFYHIGRNIFKTAAERILIENRLNSMFNLFSR